MPIVGTPQDPFAGHERVGKLPATNAAAAQGRRQDAELQHVTDLLLQLSEKIKERSRILQGLYGEYASTHEMQPLLPGQRKCQCAHWLQVACFISCTLMVCICLLQITRSRSGMGPTDRIQQLWRHWPHVLLNRKGTAETLHPAATFCTQVVKHWSSPRSCVPMGSAGRRCHSRAAASGISLSTPSTCTT